MAPGFALKEGFASASVSSFCLVKKREDIVNMLAKAHALECENAERYSCDKRMFRPQAVESDGLRSEVACEAGLCVPVQVLAYDTSVAAGKASFVADAFAPGGEFNRDEVSCYYSEAIGQPALITGAGASVAEALNEAIRSCQKARDEVVL